MAKKLKLMSLFQELQGRARVTNRRPTSEPTGIYLMQLRAQTGFTTLPRRRMTISVELQPPQVQPHPVKINHVRVAEANPVTPSRESLRRAPAGENPNLPQVRPDIG